MTALSISSIHRAAPRTEVRLSPATLTVGTLVMTATGERAVEDLKAGDRVLTKDYGMQALQSVGYGDVDLTVHPDRAPVKVPASVFGDDRPSQDVFLAPQQRMALRHRMFNLMFASREVLATVGDLAGCGGIEQVSGLRSITYISLGFLQHHLIYSGNLALDLGPSCQQTSRPTLAREEARLAASMMQPHAAVQHSPAGFPLH